MFTPEAHDRGENETDLAVQAYMEFTKSPEQKHQDLADDILINIGKKIDETKQDENLAIQTLKNAGQYEEWKTDFINKLLEAARDNKIDGIQQKDWEKNVDATIQQELLELNNLVYGLETNDAFWKKQRNQLAIMRNDLSSMASMGASQDIINKYNAELKNDKISPEKIKQLNLSIQAFKQMSTIAILNKNLLNLDEQNTTFNEVNTALKTEYNSFKNDPLNPDKIISLNLATQTINYVIWTEIQRLESLASNNPSQKNVLQIIKTIVIEITKSLVPGWDFIDRWNQGAYENKPAYIIARDITLEVAKFLPWFKVLGILSKIEKALRVYKKGRIALNATYGTMALAAGDFGKDEALKAIDVLNQINPKPPSIEQVIDICVSFGIAILCCVSVMRRGKEIIPVLKFQVETPVLKLLCNEITTTGLMATFKGAKKIVNN